jgi:hypothetical protein
MRQNIDGSHKGYVDVDVFTMVILMMMSLVLNYAVVVNR